MVRFGFGEQTGTTESGNLAKYENGHVDVSDKAFKHAVEQYPGLPPQQAVGRLLTGEDGGSGGEDGSE